MCDATPLATRYRWRAKVAGASSVFTLKASTNDPMALLKNFEPGAVVTVNVTAQSVPSAEVQVTIPVTEPAEVPASVKSVIAPLSTSGTNGDGAHRNGNGNGNGHAHAEADYSRMP